MATITKEQLMERAADDKVTVGDTTYRVAPLMAADLVAWSDKHRNVPGAHAANLDMLAMVLVDDNGERLFENGEEAGKCITGRRYLDVWDAVSDVIYDRNFPEKKE